MMIALVLNIFMMASPVHAHAGFAVDGVLKPRSDSTSLKAAPCGNVARTNAPTQLTAGDVITVQWRETINHPGHFELQYSEDGDQTWTTLKSIPDTQNGTNDLPHQFSTQLTLPTKACAQCTVRLIQSMEENPAAPSYYYSCADVSLRAASVSLPVTLPPSPSPTPAVCP